MKNKIISTVFSVILIGSFSFAQADGLLSRLFSSKGSAEFKQMLAYVPADTSYLFANKKPMPEDVVAFQLQRIQKMLEMTSNVSDDIEAIAESKTKPSKTSSNKTSDFFNALFSDIGNKLTEKKFTETGLSTTANNVIYGLETTPIIRLGIANKDAILATLKRAETRSDYKLELSKCGDYDCFINQDKESELTFVAVLIKDHIALSVFPSDKKETIINHLIGQSSPEKSYSAKDWDSFLTKNKYSGFGDGFLNLQTLFGKLKPLLVKNAKNSTHKKFDEKAFNACLNVAQEHIDNIPALLFGTKDLQLNNMDYELVFKTSPLVSAVLQTLANNTNIDKRTENAIMDLGININVANLSQALTQYSSFLADSAEKHKCKAIDPLKIRKTMGGMMMAMNMGLTQLKSLYLSIDEIEFDENAQPKKVDAFLSVGTDNPASLVSMLAILNPGFAKLKVPADGKAITIPKALIPSKGIELPPISLSQGDKKLNIMIGNDTPKLVDYKTKKANILFFSMDGKRYYEKLAKIIKAMPASKNKKTGKEQQEAVALFKSIGAISGKFQQKISADERGLVIDYHIQY